MSYKFIYEHEPSKKGDESGVYRSKRCKEKGELFTSKDKDLHTIYDLVLTAKKQHKSNIYCGYREALDVVWEDKKIEKVVQGKKVVEVKKWSYPKLSPYIWWTFDQFYQRVVKIGCAFRYLGLEQYDRVAIFASTSPFWSTIAQACYTQNLTVVTIYDTLGEEGLVHALNEGEIRTIFTNKTQFSVVKNAIHKVDTLKNVLFIEELEPDKIDQLESTRKGIRAYTYDELLEIGQKNPADPVKPTPEDIACIMYTSGTTGAPKGVLISHQNVVNTVFGVASMLDELLFYDDVLISLLPLSHILAFAVDVYIVYKGIRNGYASPRTLMDTTVRDCNGDLKELKPTLLVAVPQVYDSIRKGILSKVNSSGLIVKTIFNYSLYFKGILNQFNLPTWPLDMLVFNKVKEQVGGRLRFAVSGGAPISDEVRNFVTNSVALLTQGYGLTESCGLSFAMFPENIRPGCIGEVIPHNEFKLKDFVEGNYSHKNNPKQGELWLRGGSIASGYYKNKKATDEAFTDDGWFQTGDIVQINSDGQLSVIDRKKNLVKLANGEYIALERLESIYRLSEFVQNICLVANSHHYKPAAVIVPSLDAFEYYAKNNNLPVPHNIEDISRNKDFIDAAYKSCIKEGKNAGLKTAELISGLYIVPEEWTTDNGMLTAAQKLKRKDVEKKYKNEIEKLF